MTDEIRQLKQATEHHESGDRENAEQLVAQVATRNQANLNRLAQMGMAPPLEIVIKERLDFLTDVVVHLLGIDDAQFALAWEQHFDRFLERALDAAPKALLLDGVGPKGGAQ